MEGGECIRESDGERIRVGEWIGELEGACIGALESFKLVEPDNGLCIEDSDGECIGELEGACIGESEGFKPMEPDQNLNPPPEKTCDEIISTS